MSTRNWRLVQALQECAGGRRGDYYCRDLRLLFLLLASCMRRVPISGTCSNAAMRQRWRCWCSGIIAAVAPSLAALTQQRVKRCGTHSPRAQWRFVSLEIDSAASSTTKINHTRSLTSQSKWYVDALASGRTFGTRIAEKKKGGRWETGSAMASSAGVSQICCRSMSN